MIAKAIAEALFEPIKLQRPGATIHLVAAPCHQWRAMITWSDSLPEKFKVRQLQTNLWFYDEFMTYECVFGQCFSYCDPAFPANLLDRILNLSGVEETTNQLRAWTADQLHQIDEITR